MLPAEVSIWLRECSLTSKSFVIIVLEICADCTLTVHQQVAKGNTRALEQHNEKDDSRHQLAAGLSFSLYYNHSMTDGDGRELRLVLDTLRLTTRCIAWDCFLG